MLFRSDFDEDQYPPAEDRYKQLEDRLSAMEVQKVPGLDFGDLGLSSGGGDSPQVQSTNLC